MIFAALFCRRRRPKIFFSFVSGHFFSRLRRFFAWARIWVLLHLLSGILLQYGRRRRKFWHFGCVFVSKTRSWVQSGGIFCIKHHQILKIFRLRRAETFLNPGISKISKRSVFHVPKILVFHVPNSVSESAADAHAHLQIIFWTTCGLIIDSVIIEKVWHTRHAEQDTRLVCDSAFFTLGKVRLNKKILIIFIAN